MCCFLVVMPWKIIAVRIKNPPIMVLVSGVSLIPMIGNQAQKIPATTSSSVSSTSSPLGKYFAPKPNRINPTPITKPLIKLIPKLIGYISKLPPVATSKIDASITLKKPPSAGVSNLGISGLWRMVIV